MHHNWFAGAVGAWVNLAVTTTPTYVNLHDNIFDDTHPQHQITKQVLANLNTALTVPGLPASTGVDTTNNNVLVSTGLGVTVTRYLEE